MGRGAVFERAKKRISIRRRRDSTCTGDSHEYITGSDAERSAQAEERREEGMRNAGECAACFYTRSYIAGMYIIRTWINMRVPGQRFKLENVFLQGPRYN